MKHNYLSWTQWIEKNKLKLNLFVLVIFLVLASGSSILWLKWEKPLLSPISATTTFHFIIDNWLRQATQPAIIYGFLPYWNLDSALINKPLTHVSYFSLTIGPDGGLETQGDSESLAGYKGLQSEEFLDLIQKLEDKNIKLELVLKQFSNTDALAFLPDSQAHSNLFSQLDSLILAYPISGINLDFEITEIKPDNQAQFTQFVKDLRQHLNTTHKNIRLSIDVYASAGQGTNLWNIASLEPYVDWFVVMAYDFHQRGSAQAGPVAPLISANGANQSNINSHLKEFLEQTPSEKILLGVPFYGYEWQTTSRNQTATTYPGSGKTANYKAIKEILSQKKALKVQESWNDDNLVPYLSYEKDGKTFIIYYENANSLSYKLDYVNQLNLAGIAIWALGYEGDNLDFWKTISDKL